MNKIKKLLKVFVTLLFFGFAISSCTANFCSNKDKACMMYVNYGTVEGRNKLIEEAQATVDIPNEIFWNELDTMTLEFATKEAQARNSSGSTDVLVTYGYALYLDDNYAESNSNNRVLWGNFDKFVTEFNSKNEENEKLGPSKDFVDFYKTKLNNLTQNYRTCITPVDGQFGGEKTGIYDVEGKSWSYAWNHGGIIEFLLVYPISWGVHQLSMAFGANGWGQLLAIVVITIIVRGLMMLVTFKSTMAQSKMTALQPELAKLQAKYPNSDSNQYEKQRLAQAQMELYKKHKINPLSQLLVMILQFPVFIAVWGALQGSAILATGNIFGLELSAGLGSEMINFSNVGSCITAIVLFILMAAAQLVSMKLPQWIQKKANKKVSKMGANPAMDKSQSQMKMMNNIMLVMIIVMGISLPSAMGVYWLVSALISIAQTLITQKILARKKKK